MATATLQRPGGGGMLGIIFAGYVQLASQSSYPIIVYSVGNKLQTPSQSLLGKYVIFTIPTQRGLIYNLFFYTLLVWDCDCWLIYVGWPLYRWLLNRVLTVIINIVFYPQSLFTQQKHSHLICCSLSMNLMKAIIRSLNKIKLKQKKKQQRKELKGILLSK